MKRCAYCPAEATLWDRAFGWACVRCAYKHDMKAGTRADE